MTRRVTVAWHKRNLLRKIVTQGNLAPRRKLTAAGIKMTRHARMAWRREKFVRKDCTKNQAQQETANDEMTRRDCGNAWNATMV
jgi:hypothetical protein